VIKTVAKAVQFGNHNTRHSGGRTTVRQALWAHRSGNGAAMCAAAWTRPTIAHALSHIRARLFPAAFRKKTMTSHMYSQSIPVFKQLLTAMKAVLAEAASHAAAHSIEPDAYLQARLFPDMFALLKQVQIAADFSRGVSARLAGVAVPANEGQEKTFADLDALLTQTVAFLDSLQADQFDGCESREIVLRPGTPKEKKLSGHTYLVHYGLPQFFFHVTTVYAILRHNGIKIGKKDYIGAY
jgi:hypothetical protein